jgi:hypothetical protein
MNNKKLIGTILGSLTLASPALAQEAAQANLPEAAKTAQEKDKGTIQACRAASVTVDKGSEQACRTLTVTTDKGSAQACNATGLLPDPGKGADQDCKASHRVNGNSKHIFPRVDK